MIKLFMTGDNHIGLKYLSHEQSAALASARIDAFRQMIDTANSENCSLFVITGDLFDRTYGIAKRDVKAVTELLSSFNGTVAVLPGNHDYYDKEVKVWESFRETLADNTLLLTDYRPYEISLGDEQAVLYPALCTSLHSERGENKLGWIKDTMIPRDNRYHIGIAHGAVEGETIDNEGQYFLMTRAELEEIPVDAWLIGHTHVPFSDGERIFNAGTHVQTDVACNSEGCCFILEIDSDKTVRAKKYISGNLRFYRKNIELTAGSMEETLTRELESIGDNSVVELVLGGAVSQEEYEARDVTLRGMLSRFIEGTYNDYALSKLISEELIKSEFSETSFAADFLGALLNEPKEAQLAYELLKSLDAERSGRS